MCKQWVINPLHCTFSWDRLNHQHETPMNHTIAWWKYWHRNSTQTQRWFAMQALNKNTTRISLNTSNYKQYTSHKPPASSKATIWLPQFFLVTETHPKTLKMDFRRRSQGKNMAWQSPFKWHQTSLSNMFLMSSPGAVPKKNMSHQTQPKKTPLRVRLFWRNRTWTTFQDRSQTWAKINTKMFQSLMHCKQLDQLDTHKHRNTWEDVMTWPPQNIYQSNPTNLRRSLFGCLG